MNQQAVAMPLSSIGWGPWQSVMEDVVSRCGDFLVELDRSVSGEIQSDLATFHELANGLYESANELVERCEDVERWRSRWHEGEKQHEE
jgi:hypothetical protein